MTSGPSPATAQCSRIPLTSTSQCTMAGSVASSDTSGDPRAVALRRVALPGSPLRARRADRLVALRAAAAHRGVVRLDAVGEAGRESAAEAGQRVGDAESPRMDRSLPSALDRGGYALRGRVRATGPGAVQPAIDPRKHPVLVGRRGVDRAERDLGDAHARSAQLQP